MAKLSYYGKEMANRNIFLIIAVVAAIILLGVVYLPEENVMLSRGPGHPDSIPVNSSPNDLDNGCEIYGSVGGFPKSPVTPTLPPKNNKDYNSPDYVCTHFAFDFCKETRDIKEITSCQILAFDSHAINSIRYIDDEGQEWVCVVEPQTNEYFCMTLDEWNNLNREHWIKNTLCRDYYKDWDLKYCNRNPWLAPRCSDSDIPNMLGKPCEKSQQGQRRACVENARRGGYYNFIEIKCNCDGAFGFGQKCEWK